MEIRIWGIDICLTKKQIAIGLGIWSFVSWFILKPLLGGIIIIWLKKIL